MSAATAPPAPADWRAHASAVRPDVFGAARLGYVVVESQRLTAWNRFGADAIGLHVDAPDRDHLRLRLDDRPCRFLIRRGPDEDVTAAGWEVDDHATFEEILHRVHAAGLPVTEGTDEQAALRGVERLWRFPGPKGIATEIFTRARTATDPLRMQNSAFVTGHSGMGHLAITTRHPEQLHTYWNNLLDLRLTDRITERVGPAMLNIRFLRAGERHHSIALANVAGLPIDPIRTRVQHINIQVARLEDLLAAHHRVTELGFAMAWSVGQHTNDRELSFYCVTPSGFELEVGWNPVVITPEREEHWEPTIYEGISIWGHTPTGQNVAELMGRFGAAVRSLREREQTVPALSSIPRGAHR
ncbi:VOC family protein [Pseudonocardia endophytica]|uniref:2,3-dihydroxybiphenyl 1,2-dioxygenase n=1 Tax=Pseudonocardia endophytica TaxID=401976 RepID=A0A4R1IB55_PSEEN|nr:VOC family protein [Pseudonocardia endophytica]TCK27642.1 2,3-dihydroxybiphenyl 1,2-dioxygenase [Pseudonocardia endophytica]